MSTANERTDTAAKDCFLDADPDAQTAMVLEDFQAAYRLLESGGLDQYGGQFAAFLRGQLVGTGPDSVDLRMKVSQEQHVQATRDGVNGYHNFRE